MSFLSSFIYISLILPRYLLEEDLMKFCKENGIHVTAFSPLGGKPVAAVAVNANVPGPLQHDIVSISGQSVLLKPSKKD